MKASLKIAIADDEREVREYFASALERLGHRIVVVAANGRELVERCLEVRPDLLITDIRMDGLSGIEAMQELSAAEPLPTILISAHYRPAEIEEEADGHVLAFLPKPVKLTELSAAVSRAASELI